MRGEDPQIAAVINVIASADPDILLLQGIDYDLNHVALDLLIEALDQAGAPYPFRLSLRPNTGIPTGLDLDGNGQLGEARDAQGYGRFSGQGGMAVLSRHPIRDEHVQDFSSFLWRDLPGGSAQDVLSQEAQVVQRLASVAAWEVPIAIGPMTLTLMAFHATPPVFDGPEDRNGLRNRDELRFWQLRIEGWQPGFAPPVTGPFAVMGVFNADPVDGDARREVLHAVLTHPHLQDPRPISAGAAALGDATDTVDWQDPDPGNLRVDYVLPSSDLTVLDTGVVWPEESDGNLASRHRLVWVDLMLEGEAER